MLLFTVICKYGAVCKLACENCDGFIYELRSRNSADIEHIAAKAAGKMRSIGYAR